MRVFRSSLRLFPLVPSLPLIPSLFLVPVLLFGLLSLAGCRIETHKNGKNDNVDIGTPFGSMHVKTDDTNALAQTGLTGYPGATPVHKEGHDNGSADVNMSFGGFKLGIHAAELQTPDTQDKVLAFYRKDLGRYGTVLTCKGSHTIGQPARTGEGLTCSNDTHGEGDDDLELKAGSEQHQHVVGITTRDGGTRIGLVAIDLPSDGKTHDADERE